MALAVRALGRGESEAPRRPGGGAEDGRARHDAGRRAHRRARLRPRPRRRPRAAARLAATRSASGMTDAELLAWMQSDDFSHADLRRRARRWHERKLEAAVDRCWPPRRARATAGARRCSALFDACVPIVPYTPAVGVPRPREAEALARRPGAGARRAGRRRDRRHARRHPHARRDPRARRPRLRGRGDRHRHEGRPPAAARSPRSTSPSTPGSRSACRARSRSSRRSPRAATGSSTCARRGRPARPPR